MKSLIDTIKCKTFVLAFGALLGASAQASVVLSTQAPNTGGNLYQSAASTQNAESFQLGYAASISGFRWYGVSATTSDLVVRLFTNGLTSNPDDYTTQSGLSGASLTRSANPLFTLGSGPLAFEVYEFEFTLDTAYQAAANELVYVSIFASAGNWGWLSSTQGDGVSAFRGSNGTPWQFGAPDLSLTVLGDRADATVPEPASLALVGLALAAAGASRRRWR